MAWPACQLVPEKIGLPSQKELRTYNSDDELDPSDPWTRHVSKKWTVRKDA